MSAAIAALKKSRKTPWPASATKSFMQLKAFAQKPEMGGRSSINRAAIDTATAHVFFAGTETKQRRSLLCGAVKVNTETTESARRGRDEGAPRIGR